MVSGRHNCWHRNVNFIMLTYLTKINSVMCNVILSPRWCLYTEKFNFSIFLSLTHSMSRQTCQTAHCLQTFFIWTSWKIFACHYKLHGSLLSGVNGSFTILNNNFELTHSQPVFQQICSPYSTNRKRVVLLWEYMNWSHNANYSIWKGFSNGGDGGR